MCFLGTNQILERPCHIAIGRIQLSLIKLVILYFIILCSAWTRNL